MVVFLKIVIIDCNESLFQKKVAAPRQRCHLQIAMHVINQQQSKDKSIIGFPVT